MQLHKSIGPRTSVSKRVTGNTTRTHSISTHKYPEWHFYNDHKPYKTHGRTAGSASSVHLWKKRRTDGSDSEMRKPDIWTPISGLGSAAKQYGMKFPSSDFSSRRKWNKQFLDSFHMIGDPLADTTVHELIKNNHQNWYRNFMQSSFKNGQLLPAEYPSVLHEFVARSTRLPHWIDKAKIRLASEFFWRYAYAICASLNWASLPLIYSVPEGAIVLERTGELLSKTKSRILRTSKLVTSVNGSHGFEPHGIAAMNIAKVRLTHAFVRYDLCSGSAAHTWAFEKDGVAINQRDQAGTLMVFSILIIDCLERLGAHISKEEKEAVLHLWQVVGHMQGIDLRLIPYSVEDAFGLARAISREYSRSSDIGHELTKSLLEFLKEATPGKMADGVHEIMMRYLLGDEMADTVGLASYSGHAPVVIKAVKIALKNMHKVTDESATVRKGIELLRWVNLNTAVFVMSQGKTMDFNLSKSVLKDLGIAQ